MPRPRKMPRISKKIKLDPFDENVLPFDVQEHILQYLNGSDLLKTTEVSRRWNKKIENSKGFIEKIKLSITPPRLPEGIEDEVLLLQ